MTHPIQPARCPEKLSGPGYELATQCQLTEGHRGVHQAHGADGVKKVWS